MDIRVGDRVQIKNGSIDVTNGVSAVSGRMYGEGGPLWATVELIDEYVTGNRFGLPHVVTRIRCAAPNGVIVWQVTPDDIASNIIQTSQPKFIETIAPKPDNPTVTDQGIEDLGSPDETSDSDNTDTSIRGINMNYRDVEAPVANSASWVSGKPTYSNTSGQLPKSVYLETQDIGNEPFLVKEPFEYEPIENTEKVLKDTAGIQGLEFKQNILSRTFRNAIDNPDKKRRILNEDIENIQNFDGFPIQVKSSDESYNTAKYDYKIQVGDPNFPKMQSLEDKLMEARSALGIPVHGSTSIAKAMKYYMYNRYKTPDTNLAHNKSITHIFFTRPDLNLLNFPARQANSQTINHSETAVIWRRNPDLFKLLTDSSRCGDRDNFNLLLSNQITSFELQDEQLSTQEAGRSWSQYEMVYGDQYSGRSAGEFSCTFTETSDYSIINLIKLWITYIDNVARGAWLPSYNLYEGEGVNLSPNASHIYSKTLDYAASAYVFKCGPDGEDVLYWSKYYGIFPVNTGAGALSWELGQNIGDAPKLNIRFKYSYKRDMSPISLIEFNTASRVNWGDIPSSTYESSYNVNYSHSGKPYVGSPFIEAKLNTSPLLVDGSIAETNAVIRLKFKSESSDTKRLTTRNIYRATLSEEVSKYATTNESYLRNNESWR